MFLACITAEYSNPDKEKDYPASRIILSVKHCGNVCLGTGEKLPNSLVETYSTFCNMQASERFRARLRRAPRQIVRYCRRSGHGPLLCTASVPLDSPPPCSRCGAARSFEFQVGTAINVTAVTGIVSSAFYCRGQRLCV